MMKMTWMTGGIWMCLFSCCGVPHVLNEKQQSKLLEQTDGERLDTGTTGKAGKADPAMATLGEVDGTEDAGR